MTINYNYSGAVPSANQNTLGYTYSTTIPGGNSYGNGTSVISSIVINTPGVYIINFQGCLQTCSATNYDTYYTVTNADDSNNELSGRTYAPLSFTNWFYMMGNSFVYTTPANITSSWTLRLNLVVQTGSPAVLMAPAKTQGFLTAARIA
jgi:hypothetical protein